MTASDKTQRRWLRWLQTIAVTVVIAVLVVTMLRQAFWGDSWGWQQAEREVVRKRFNESLLLARTHWLSEGRPAQVTLRGDRQQYSVIMNQQGWPSSENGCRQLWQMLSNARLAEAELIAPQTCRYKLPNGEGILLYDGRLGRLD